MYHVEDDVLTIEIKERKEKMKIGILTYHRAENYGALLQAYATMTYLRSHGHNVSFVDYWPKYHSEYFKIFSLKAFLHSSLSSKLKIISRLMLMGRTLYERKQTMQEFMHDQLGLPTCPKYEYANSTTENYDTVIYGSDQIWRKQNLGGVQFDDWYFGSNNVRAKKKVVYAGSMGKIDTDENDDKYVKEKMIHFDHIAVREIDLQNYLNNLGVSSVLVADPVFLLSKEEWGILMVQPQIKGKYILFYNLLNTKESLIFAKRLSAQTGLPIYEITKKTSLFNFGGHLKYNASVGQFLGLINGAEYVVSNSFHGVAFSIIFEKQLYATGMDGKSNRVISLLSNAGIKDRYITSLKDEVLINPIDYERVKQCLRTLVDNSRSYLIQSL